MKLQIAFDFLDLQQVENILGRVAGLVDIAEVGTPMIVRYGVEAVRRLRHAFPSLPILADLKIIDGGHFESSLAFEAGASLVTVLAGADDETVREAVRAAAEFHGQIMADLMGMKSPARRAARLERLGVDYVCVHTAVDVQAADDQAALSGFAGLGDLRRSLKRAGVAVAGGVNPSNAATLVPLAPDILVVGSGVTRAPDPIAAVTRIRAAFPAPTGGTA
jgi:3-hexulose-6-phosphate synthase